MTLPDRYTLRNPIFHTVISKIWTLTASPLRAGVHHGKRNHFFPATGSTASDIDQVAVVKRYEEFAVPKSCLLVSRNLEHKCNKHCTSRISRWENPDSRTPTFGISTPRATLRRPRHEKDSYSLSYTLTTVFWTPSRRGDRRLSHGYNPRSNRWPFSPFSWERPHPEEGNREE